MTAEARPVVLLHCEWARDLEIAAALLDELGAEARPIDDPAATRAAVAAGRVDLILLDAGAGSEPLSTLLGILDESPGGVDLPLVLLANPDELPLLNELIARRFSAVLLTKPMAREQLAAAIESGLRLRARQREVRDLLAEVSRSNERLEAANRALERRQEEAAEEARRKTRFLAAISHDIRTPVNALVLSGQLLRAIGEASPTGTIDVREVDELTGALLSNAEALAELVNDLLDIARHDQGQTEFHESTFPLGEFLAATVEGMRPLAEQKRLALALDVEDPGAALRTDRVKLGRVVQNLVANAIKFTEAGEVRVSARAGDAAGLVLEVRDTGVGIPEALREGIFDEFSQLRNPERDRTKGTGLGLAICRRLVLAMGGEIAVVTPPGQAGSTFRVTLPASRVAPARKVAAADRAEGPGAAGRFRGEVLVVEDHEPSRTLLHRLLRRAGLQVRVAENGREALDEVGRARPDLVLMDLMMPVMGGVEALHALRADPGRADLPVVILTGDVGGPDGRDPRLDGATACLSKPVEVSALFELLGQLLPAAPVAG